jgi:hypothetical protein
VIFREIDFHIERYEKIDAAVNKGMRLRINHIIDSVFLRMPKKLKTDSIKKLNCYACTKKPKKVFVSHDGYCMAYVYFFSGDVFFLLTRPLMGGPKHRRISILP